MNIINSDIARNEHDIFWGDVSGVVSDMNAKPVLVIATKAEDMIAAETLLAKMLDAAGMSKDQYNTVWLEAGQQVAWHQLRQRLNPYIVFLIGVLPATLGVSALFRLNESNPFSDTIWLPTVTFEQLEQHPEAKKQLWAGMKRIFLDKIHGEIAAPAVL